MRHWYRVSIADKGVVVIGYIPTHRLRRLDKAWKYYHRREWEDIAGMGLMDIVLRSGAQKALDNLNCS